jgi:3-oxoadipate enol-lactonase
VVAHGFGASIAETRPVVSGTPGTRVFYEARGHGTAPSAVGTSYAELAEDLLAVADAHGATQAVGVSLGAGTLLRLLCAHPSRFSRLLLFLPAAVDGPLSPFAVRRSAGLTQALATDDAGAVEAWVRSELPPGLSGPSVEAYVHARVGYLLASDLEPLVDVLARDRPVADRSLLGAVTADVLVVGQQDDPLHPASVARDLGTLLPRCRVEVFARPGVMFRERARLRTLVAGHLDGPSG